METVEEKANEFLDKNIVDLFGSPPDAAYNGFIAEAESGVIFITANVKCMVSGGFKPTKFE